MDLEAYFQRIGYSGPVEPEVAVLHAITAAHARTIPFENISVLLREPIELQPEALFEKLVTRRRGGYCFEHNGLLEAVLAQIGFPVRSFTAGVRLLQADRSVPVGHTHLMLHVKAEGEDWITDVGIGAPTLTAALRLVPDVIQETPHDRRRLQKAPDRWYHQIERETGWVDVCEFFERELCLPDRVIASWYTSTHPSSSFQRGLVVACARPQGARISLRENRLCRRDRQGRVSEEDIPDAETLRERLRTEFDLELAPGDCRTLFAVWERGKNRSS